MKGIVKKIHHSHKVIVLINKLVEMKCVIVNNNDHLKIYPEVFHIVKGEIKPKHTSVMINLYTYARLKLNMPENKTLVISDIETELPLAKIYKDKVSWAP